MEKKHPIRSHPFFWEIDWDKLDNKQLEPPFKPHVVRLCLDFEWQIRTYDLLCMSVRIVYHNFYKHYVIYKG